MKQLNKTILHVLLLIVTLAFNFSCKKYLEEKTDKKLVVPSTIKDAAALMDAYDLMVIYYPDLGTLGDDDLFFTTTIFNAEKVSTQNNYLWAREVYNDTEWGYLYQMVLYSNISLETLENITPLSSNIEEWKRVYGSALYSRANAFYHAAQYYATPYIKSTAAQELGIPLRLDSDPNKVSIRSTLQQTYDRIIADFSKALEYLPASTSVITRPNRAAAFGMLARVYLTMGEYTLAKQNADSSLSYNNSLLDYNTINGAVTYPFAQWNAEVVTPTGMYTFFGGSNMYVDSLLYRSYDANDLRKSLFFRATTGGNFNFRGSYQGTAGSFGGITTAELYLIRAEANARLGNKTAAIADLNTLMVKRFKTGTFIPFTAVDATEALVKILTERRKELLKRGTRWIDLRRLNLEPAFAKTITKVINAVTYTLPPNDPRYTHYIPALVISLSGMQQNTR